MSEDFNSLANSWFLDGETHIIDSENSWELTSNSESLILNSVAAPSQQATTPSGDDLQRAEREKELQRARQKRYYQRQKAKSQCIAALCTEREAQLAAEQETAEELCREEGALKSIDKISLEMMSYLKEADNLNSSASSDTENERQSMYMTSTADNEELILLAPVLEAHVSNRENSACIVPLGPPSYLENAAFNAAVEELPPSLIAAAKGSGADLLKEWQKFAVNLEGILFDEELITVELNKMGLALTLAMQQNPSAMLGLWKAGAPAEPPKSDKFAYENWQNSCDRLYRNVISAMQPTKQQFVAARGLWQQYLAASGTVNSQGAGCVLELYNTFLTQPGILPDLGKQTQSRECLSGIR